MSFDSIGFKYIPKLIPKEFCDYFTHVLLRKADLEGHGDLQCPNAKAIMDHEILFETLQERLWPIIEGLINEELIPTYSYARLYGNGDKLERHKDREACEISVTIQLGRSHNYSWPIYMEDARFDLAEGSGVIYKGCEIEHWREECNGPLNYYSGQVFLHFVKKNGMFQNHVGDSSIRDKYSYLKNRTFLMEFK